MCEIFCLIAPNHEKNKRLNALGCRGRINTRYFLCECVEYIESDSVWQVKTILTKNLSNEN